MPTDRKAPARRPRHPCRNARENRIVKEHALGIASALAVALQGGRAGFAAAVASAVAKLT
jgi:hypothetical protein